MKITQDMINDLYDIRMGIYGYSYVEEDVKKIQDTLRGAHGVFFCHHETVMFWRWRCERVNSSWFSPGDDTDTLGWFRKYLEYYGVETPPDEEI